MNNKGSFKDDGSVGQKFKSFFKESGFYIAIVVGLCALAAGAVYFSTNQILTEPEPKAQEDGFDKGNDLGLIEDGPTEDEGPDQSSIVDYGAPIAEEGPYAGMDEGDDEGDIALGDEQTAQKPEEQATTAKNDQTASANEQEAQSTSGGTEAIADDNAATEDVVLAVVRPAFNAPVSGKIQAEYSMDKLVFSPTFNEWRTHSGVDLAAPRGDVVRAVGSGVVSEIKNDPRYGFTIVIDHNNGYKSVYSNLVTDQTMQIGQEVKQGDPIGAVGATAIFESAEPTHLHFELYKENKLVDPAAYIDFAK